MFVVVTLIINSKDKISLRRIATENASEVQIIINFIFMWFICPDYGHRVLRKSSMARFLSGSLSIKLKDQEL